MCTFNTCIGVVDLSCPKVRVDGVVMDKFSLVEFLRRLDFKRFYWSLMYAYDTHSYKELRTILIRYLTNTL